jgi:hypothetical protein
MPTQEQTGTLQLAPRYEPPLASTFPTGPEHSRRWSRNRRGSGLRPERWCCQSLRRSGLRASLAVSSLPCHQKAGTPALTAVLSPRRNMVELPGLAASLRILHTPSFGHRRQCRRLGRNVLIFTNSVRAALVFVFRRPGDFLLCHLQPEHKTSPYAHLSRHTNRTVTTEYRLRFFTPMKRTPPLQSGVSA